MMAIDRTNAEIIMRMLEGLLKAGLRDLSEEMHVNAEGKRWRFKIELEEIDVVDKEKQ